MSSAVQARKVVPSMASSAAWEGPASLPTPGRSSASPASTSWPSASNAATPEYTAIDLPSVAPGASEGAGAA